MTTREKFTSALDGLIARVKADRSVLAAVLCGSLSHDAVWDKSDIDLTLITIDDKKVGTSQVSLYADGVNVHACLMPRAEFRKSVEGALRSSFMHSYLAKGQLLYTHDETIAELFERLNEIGERDTQVQLLSAGTAALAPVYKAHKFFITRGDLDYAALWILASAESLARIEVVNARLLVDREVLPQAMKLNPAFFKIVYSDLIKTNKTRANVEAALKAVDGYLAARASILFRLVLEHLREAGEARSCTEIEDYFKRQFDVRGVTTACEYLADLGLIGKVSIAVQLTKRSNVQVEEMAFVAEEAPVERG